MNKMILITKMLREKLWLMEIGQFLRNELMRKLLIYSTLSYCIPLYFVTTAPFLFNGSLNFTRREVLPDMLNVTLVGGSGQPVQGTIQGPLVNR